jgi:hypothetical protein
VKLQHVDRQPTSSSASSIASSAFDRQRDFRQTRRRERREIPRHLNATRFAAISRRKPTPYMLRPRARRRTRLRARVNPQNFIAMGMGSSRSARRFGVLDKRQNLVAALVLLAFQRLNLALELLGLAMVCACRSPVAVLTQPFPDETDQNTGHHTAQDHHKERQLDRDVDAGPQRQFLRQHSVSVTGSRLAIAKTTSASATTIKNRYLMARITFIASPEFSCLSVQTVQPVPEKLARLEERHMLFLDIDAFTSAWVPTDAGVALFHRKRTEAAQLNPVSVGQSLGDLFENRVDDAFNVALVEMRVFICELLNEL